jgi:glycosyltransferase involved in cell wall biosynthesis
MTRAARQHRVYFFEEPIFENVDEPRLDLRDDSSGVVIAAPVLPIGLQSADTAIAQSALLDRLLAGLSPDLLITWYYTPMALAFSAHIEPDLCVYDNMDELALFAGAPLELVEMEQLLLSRAGLVFTGGHSLYEAKRGRHANLHAFPSSIDVPHFARARQAPPEPADQSTIAHPRLGFFGVIDERMDLGLLNEVALRRPDWQFIMIGPVVKIDSASLPRLANIHWLGPKPYASLPDYLAGWDVGIMPFALNEATRFISPTKTPEFLAAGIPVVSTPITDVVRPYGDARLVEIAGGAECFLASAERLLNGVDRNWIDRVDRHLGLLSWDKTWRSMSRLIERGISTRNPAQVSSMLQGA